MMENKIIGNYIENVIEIYKNINQNNIVDVYNILIKTVNNGGNIYICGNGGSASTASHFKTDLNNFFAMNLKSMPAICLADNLSTITAISNDYSYDEVFLHQLKYLLKNRDVLIVISGSGNSKNVIKATEYTKSQGNIVISMVGFDGGKLKEISDYCFHVNIDNMQIVEDLHLFYCHMISTLIKECGGK